MRIIKFSTLMLLLVIGVIAKAQNLSFEGYKIIKQVKATPVKDQSMSPTCWSFATVSFIESELLRKGVGEFDLSEMYIAHNVYLRKAVQHYRMMGNNFLTGGGQPHNVMLTIKSAGIVPESIYSGKGKAIKNHDHTLLDAEVKKFMDKIAEVKDTLSPDWKDKFVKLLEKHLGKLPKSFNYRGKEYTPKEFNTEVLRINPDDYIEITSYMHHPFYTLFCLESRYNWEQQLYFNVPLDEFVEIIKNAINTGYSVCWNGDVSEPEFSAFYKVVDLNTTGKNDQQKRQELFDNHSTTVDHVMHLIGIAENGKKEPFYLMKNSWGNYHNNGYFLMSDDYLKLKTVSIMVHKDAIPESIRMKIK